MYSLLPSFVLGFHSCDANVAEGIFSGKIQHLKPSENSYDWLGTGIYFWETSPTRALQYAIQRQSQPAKKKQIRTPAVIGAVIDLGNCLDLLDSQFFDLVREAYHELKRYTAVTGLPMHKNRALHGSKEILLRDLDCYVVNTIHQTYEGQKRTPFDTVRAAFIEGKPLYPTANFHDKNHIQICVRNPKMIKGYFRPINE